MKIVYNKKDKPKVGYKEVDVMKVAKTLYNSNSTFYMMAKIDPLDYIQRLLSFGVKAVAIPVIKDKKLIGYKFRTNKN